MKRKTRLIACGCALVLLLSLAACRETPASTENSSEYATENTSVEQADPAAESVSAAASDTLPTEDITGASQSGAGDETVPQGQNQDSTAASNQPLSRAQVLALYEAGVKQASNLKRVKYSRRLSYGKLWSPGNFDGAEFNLMEDEKALPIFNGTDTAKANASLPALKDSMVESASCRESGGKRILTIKLKSNAGDNSIASGAGGYLDLVDFEQVGDMAKAYGKAMFPLANIKTKAIQTTLSAGTYAVTLAADGKIEKASLTYQQTVKGDMKLSFPSYEIQCDVRFQMSVDYAV